MPEDSNVKEAGVAKHKKNFVKRRRICKDPAARYPWAAQYSKSEGNHMNNFKSMKQ